MRKGLVAAALLAVWIVSGCFEKVQAVPIIDEAMDVRSGRSISDCLLCKDITNEDPAMLPRLLVQPS